MIYPLLSLSSFFVRLVLFLGLCAQPINALRYRAIARCTHFSTLTHGVCPWASCVDRMASEAADDHDPAFDVEQPIADPDAAGDAPLGSDTDSPVTVAFLQSYLGNIVNALKQREKVPDLPSAPCPLPSALRGQGQALPLASSQLDNAHW
jgi:hypothetical protein